MPKPAPKPVEQGEKAAPVSPGFEDDAADDEVSYVRENSLPLPKYFAELYD